VVTHRFRRGAGRARPQLNRELKIVTLKVLESLPPRGARGQYAGRQSHPAN